MLLGFWNVTVQQLPTFNKLTSYLKCVLPLVCTNTKIYAVVHYFLLHSVWYTVYISIWDSTWTLSEMCKSAVPVLYRWSLKVELSHPCTSLGWVTRACQSIPKSVNFHSRRLSFSCSSTELASACLSHS